jgi:cytochrome bd-type quinol oxidase subunit 1
MGKFYILVFVLSVIFILYVINKRTQQKDKEKESDNKDIKA